MRNPFVGIGKAESLRENLSCRWWRRIDAAANVAGGSYVMRASSYTSETLAGYLGVSTSIHHLQAERQRLRNWRSIGRYSDG